MEREDQRQKLVAMQRSKQYVPPVEQVAPEHVNPTRERERSRPPTQRPSAPPMTRANRPRSPLGRLLVSPMALRQAFVVMEILRPPVTLRPPNQEDIP